MPVSPARIGFFLPDLDFGGVERVVFELGRSMSERGWDFDLVVASRRGTAAATVPDAFRVVDLGVGRSVAAIPGLSRYLRHQRPRALLAAKDHTNLVAIAAGTVSRAGVPVIVTADTRPSETLADPERWTGHVVRRLVRPAYERAAAVIAVSDGVANDVRRLAPRATVRTVHNPVITPRLLAARTTAPPHPWLASDEKKPTLVWCGRIAEAKDPRCALDALALLRQTVDARMLFVGDGPDRPALELDVQARGLADHVAIVGYVDEPEPYVAAADLLLFTSQGREGLPTVIVEALALGTRVVATDCDTGPREILDHGRLGPLVPVGDAPALARAAEAALADTTWTITDDDLATYQAGYATDRYLDVIEEVAGS